MSESSATDTPVIHFSSIFCAIALYHLLFRDYGCPEACSTQVLVWLIFVFDAISYRNSPWMIIQSNGTMPEEILQIELLKHTAVIQTERSQLRACMENLFYLTIYNLRRFLQAKR